MRVLTAFTLRFHRRALCLIALFSVLAHCPISAAPGTNTPAKTTDTGPRITGGSTLKLDEYFPSPHETQLKNRISAARSVPAPQGRYQISDVKVETWLTNGQPDLIIETPECTYDESKKVVYSPGSLRMRTADARFAIQGEGFLLLQTNSVLFVSNRVHTTVRPANAGRAEASPRDAHLDTRPEELEIFANHFRYSNDAGLGVYDGDVKVVGTNLSVTCQNAEVRVPIELRALQSIQAFQHVVMDYDMGDREIRKIHVTGDDALYTATNGIMTVRGNPTWRADQRDGRGDELVLDTLNKSFRANTNAFLRVPSDSLSSLGIAPNQGASTSAAASTSTTNGFVEVFSDHYLFETNFASFGDQVRVNQTAGEETKAAMTCSRMFLYLAATNQIETMVAEENVSINQSTNQFHAAKAIYTRTNQLITFTGNPTWRSGLSEGKGDVVQMNVQNQEMFVITNAYMRLPASQLGRSFSPAGSAPAASTNQAAQQFAEITSRQYTIKTNSALFTGAVRAKHPSMDWACEKMDVDSSSVGGKEATLQAQGSVDFHLAEMQGRIIHGLCEKAVYTYRILSGVTNEMVVLTGNPILEAADGTITNSIIFLDVANHRLSAPGKYKLYGQAPRIGTNLLDVLKTRINPATR